MAFELGTDGPSVLLVGYDGSEPATRAAAWASGLARRNGALLVVAVVEVPPAAVGLVPAGLAAWQQAAEDFAAQTEGLLATEAARLGLRTRLVRRRGDVAGELLAVAEEVRADVLVVGASSQTGRRVLGSVPGRLVRSQRLPVTVVP